MQCDVLSKIAWVDYVGFPDSPYHELARKYLDGQAPSLLTFGVKGGLEAAKAFYDALKLVKRLVNIGDTRTLCCHPASTTHRQMTPDEQRRAGVSVETIRLSVASDLNMRRTSLKTWITHWMRPRGSIGLLNIRNEVQRTLRS
jgi:O-acetylhomoserine/O-acetylserine sulfhydrylase-like pyridoxal-dependent enzyme